MSMTLTGTATSTCLGWGRSCRSTALRGLVGSLDAEPAEGDPPSSTVVIRFADAEAAWGFLNDPDYQPVKEIRLSITSRGQMVVAPGFTPAG
jgi:uncharacterized protein (DUF1330 family)